MITTHLPYRAVQLCTLLLFFPMLFPTLSQAEIYRSIDKNGQPYYSDTPHASSELYQSGTYIQPMPKPQLPKLKRSKKKAPKKKSTKAQEDKKRAKLQKRCESLEKKIKKVNYKLRQGHSNDQGNRLRKQRRGYSDQLSKECRR